MTISLPIDDIVPRIQYISGPAQIPFNIPFYLFAAEDISVYKTPVGNTPNDNQDLLTLGTDYTVILNGGDVGGTVNLVVGANAGDLITLVRTMADERLNYYRTGGTFSIPMLNPDFESLVLMSQQAKLYDQRYSPHYALTTNPQQPDNGPTYFTRDMVLPVLGAGQGWIKDLANQEIIAATIPFIPPGEDFVTFVPPSVPLAMTRWNNNDGLLESTGVICDALNNLTGITSAEIGNVRIIQSSLVPIAGNSLFSQADWHITQGQKLKLLNPANTFFTSIQAPALAQDIEYTMPLLPPPANGAFLSSTIAGQWSWVVPAFPAGDVTGPGASTDNAITRFDGVTGKIIQNSGILLDDANNITQVNRLEALDVFIRSIQGGGVPKFRISYGGTVDRRVVMPGQDPTSPDEVLGPFSAGPAPLWTYKGGGYQTVKTVTQNAHGFVRGNILKASNIAAQFQLAQANNLANSEAVGIVVGVPAANEFRMVTFGNEVIDPGLVVGDTYYLDPVIPGVYTNVRPNVVGQVIKPIFIANSTANIFVNIQLGQVVVGGGGGGITGPAASTDRALVRWNGIGGNALLDSNVVLDDTDNMTGLQSVQIGNMELTSAGVTANINSLGPNGNIRLTGGPAGQVFCENPLLLENSSPLRFTDGVSTINIGIGNGILINSDYKLPPFMPTGTVLSFLQCSPTGDMQWQGVPQNIILLTQAAHGFTVGKVIAINNAGVYILANAMSPLTAEVVGIVVQVSDANNFYISMNGRAAIGGLTPGAVHYLNYSAVPAQNGTLTTVAPVTPGFVNKPVVIGLDATFGVLVNQRGIIV